jgi:fructose-1,6-bisphosphatase-3
MIDPSRLPLLRALSRRFPGTLSVLTEIGYLASVLSLPKDTVHVVSDVHGEHKKLRHILNNASGSLRPLVDQILGDRLSDEEKRDLLAVVYYPREAHAKAAPKTIEERRAFVLRALSLEIEIARALARDHTDKRVAQVLAPAMRPLFRELLSLNGKAASAARLAALVEPFVAHGRDLALLRAAARFIRNLTVDEVVVAGDLGDRGPRLDMVIDLLMRLPRVAVVWGNHDASWMGACLGQEALIATVVRISMRYARLAQLEEGYGIPLMCLEQLARTAYADDPAERFAVHGEGAREPLLVARMQKAAAIMQFKLEGAVHRRRPEFGLESRCLLHRIDPKAGTVTVDGVTYPLLDTRFPTIDWSDPYALSEQERSCMAELKEAFLHSPVLWRHMTWVERQGSMWARRDLALIFHGCVPVSKEGDFLPFPVGGVPERGKALFEALQLRVHRAFRTRSEEDMDLLYYLWTGPLSPLFGKDKMATFEGYFIADKKTHEEHKNPYFQLIHEEGFCEKVLAEFGMDTGRGLIVNGHVPVKLEKGESPVKRSGRAVTIDGAFSEAYGDRGYTLVLDASRTVLAQHHHFESVEDAVMRGADIIPKVEDIQVYDRPRTVGDTEKGEEIRREIEVLEELLVAYEENAITEAPEEAV